MGKVAILIWLGITTSVAQAAPLDEWINVRITENSSVPMRIRTPDLKSAKRLPALLVFGGFQDAAHVLDLIRPSEPVILASFDYPFTGERVFRFPQSLALLPEARDSVRATLAAIPEATRLLAALPRVDPHRVTLIGASVGAPFVLSTAADSRAARGVVLIHGFGRLPETIARQFESAWRRKQTMPDLFVGPVAWLLSRVAWLYVGVPAPEVEGARLRADQKVLVIDALEDAFIPREASDAQWEAISKSAARQERITLPGGHLQPGSDALIQDILGHVTEWLIREGLLGPAVSAK